MSAGATAKAYLDLCRVSNLPTVWTNVLAACLLAGGGLDFNSTLLIAVSMSCFYLAGMALNDLCDREYDREKRPMRPLPSGRITVTDAWIFTLSLFATGFLIIALAPYLRAAFAAILLLAAIVAYDRHHKQNPFSVLLMASCRLLIFILSALAITGKVPAAVILPGCLQFSYIVLLSLVARHENQISRPFPFPLIPVMLAGISLLDGVILAVLITPPWFLAGVAGFLLTRGGQRYVRGD